jgi:hypothetical protein
MTWELLGVAAGFAAVAWSWIKAVPGVVWLGLFVYVLVTAVSRQVAELHLRMEQRSRA